MTPGDGKDNKPKDRLKRLVDWVNAEEPSPDAEAPAPDKDAPVTAHSHENHVPSDDAGSDEHTPPTPAAAEDYDYEEDNEFEYPDEVVHEDIEDFDEDYVAGDETHSAVPHEILHLTMQQKKQMERFRLFYLVLSAIVAINLIILLLFTVSALPEFGTADRPTVNEVYVRYVEQGLADTGAPNLVAAVLFSYRSFDTLGEAFVLFTAVIAVMILMQKPKDEDAEETDGKGDHER